MHLQSLTDAYNCAKHESTGHSPFYLMYLRKPRLPVDLLIRPRFQEAEDVHPQSTYVQQLGERLQEATRKVEQLTDVARQKQEAAYDKKSKNLALHPDDLVLVANKSLRGRC